MRSFPDVFYVEYIKGADGRPGGDVFFFDYGVVATWGACVGQVLTRRRVLAGLIPFALITTAGVLA